MRFGESERIGKRKKTDGSGGRRPLFPMFIDLEGRAAVVVGGGRIAARRVRALLECGACVRVVAPSFDASFDGMSQADVERVVRRYEEGDLTGAVLAVAATDDRTTNRRVGEEARRQGIPVSVADAPGECTFFFPAFVSEGDVVAAVSSGGRSPGLSGRLAGRLRCVWDKWVVEDERGKLDEGFCGKSEACGRS